MNTLAIYGVNQGDGDQSILLSTDTFTAQQVLVQIDGLPESWEYAGKLFKLIDIGSESSPNWVIHEYTDIIPHTPRLVSWSGGHPYRLMVRLVKYIKPSLIEVVSVEVSEENPEPEESFFLDPYPGAMVFALEQYYSDFAGPFLEGDASNPTRVIGNLKTADVINGATIVDGTAIQGDGSTSRLDINGGVTLSANRLVIGVFKALSAGGNSANRAKLILDAETIFELDSDDNFYVFAPKLNGQWQGGYAGGIPYDDAYLMLSVLVQDNRLKVYVNGTMVNNQSVSDLASADGYAQLRLKGSAFKLFASWPDTAIPSDLGALHSDIMSHYGIV